MHTFFASLPNFLSKGTLPGRLSYLKPACVHESQCSPSIRCSRIDPWLPVSIRPNMFGEFQIIMISHPKNWVSSSFYRLENAHSPDPLAIRQSNILYECLHIQNLVQKTTSAMLLGSWSLLMWPLSRLSSHRSLAGSVRLQLANACSDAGRGDLSGKVHISAMRRKPVLYRK